MNDGVLIATTANVDLQSLGTGGQPAIAVWGQIATHLRRVLGAAHANLLTEPNADSDRGTTDWYGQGEGKPVPLSSLEPSERAAVEAELARLVAEIRAESDRLKSTRDPSSRFLGEMLGLAMSIPDLGSVHVLGGAPMLVAWGHAPAGGAARPELLLGLAFPLPTTRARVPGRTPMRIVGPPPAPMRRSLTPLAWLALLLPLAVAVFLRFDPFRWLVPPAPVCTIDAAEPPLMQDLQGAREQENRLRSELARLNLALGDRRTQCPATPAAIPVPASPPAAQPTPQQRIDLDRARERGGQAGRVQVVLAWDDQNDLDLVVICPGGGEISFRSRTACGGTLDVDANLGPPFITTPVENIVFPQPPPPGHYAVRVYNSVHHPPANQASRFRLLVRVEGEPDRTASDTVETNQYQTFSFDVAPRP